MSVYIAGYARTPFLRFTGGFASVTAVQLGAHAARVALERSGLPADRVEFVYAGQVLQAAAGQNPARQSAVGAGIPLTTPAMTLNAVCLSGMMAVAMGAQLIRDGEVDVVVAIGQESMSLAPHAWSGSRAGARYGAVELVDTLELDGLTDAFESDSMGASTERYNGTLGIGRGEQDEWAARSHARLAAGRDFLAGEIAPYEIRSRRGAVVHDHDDGLREDTTVESLSRLAPAFSKDGTITAGNSSQITDGAAALVLVSDKVVLDHRPLAEVVGHAMVAGPDVSLQAQPSRAIAAACLKAGVPVTDLSIVEINEAFASVAVHSTRQLGIDEAIVNPFGGAIALGHPIGASGARIVGVVARQLADSAAGTLGAAGICGGGGQGAAVLLRAV